LYDAGKFVYIWNVSSFSPWIHQVLEQGESRASNQLLPLVYQELRRVAGHRMSHQPPGQTLQPTALVHEAFLRITGNAEQTWIDRQHFFAAASEAMRHILIDRARRKASLRHGGGQLAVELEEDFVATEATDDRLIALDEALVRLAAHDPEAAELVKLRFFGGFTFVEAGELLNISERTAKRVWNYARAWLYEEMGDWRSANDI
jgi:RNA polymerase sigma factor (TIGR02999 family)